MRVKLTDIITPIAPPPSKGFVHSVEKHGQIESVILVSEGDKYRIIAGKRRVLAAKSKGQETIEAEVKVEIGKTQETIISLLTNMQRSPNPADEADGMQHLISEGYTVKGIAEELGISLTKVQQRLKLLELIPALFEKLRNGSMSAEAGRIATALTKEQQEELASHKEVTIHDVKILRHSQQLNTLDVDSIEIPETIIDEKEIIATRLEQIANQMGSGWKKEALLTAVKALMIRNGIEDNPVEIVDIN